MRSRRKAAQTSKFILRCPPTWKNATSCITCKWPVAFSHFTMLMLMSSSTKTRSQGKDAWLQQTLRRVQGLAREIEKLAPSVDRQQSPANAEYPWAEGENIIAPCRHPYAVMVALQSPNGNDFLKLLQGAIDGYFGTQPA